MGCGPQSTSCGQLSVLMTAGACIEAWEAHAKGPDGAQAVPLCRAEAFDALFPACACEAHSFAGKASPLLGDDQLARIMTTPGTFNETTKEIIWPKLVRVYTDGISCFRPGCTEGQLLAAIKQLMEGGAEPQVLYGAAVLTVGDVRGAGDPDRWFCVHDTEADEFSEHADIIGTRPDAPSKTKLKEIQSSRIRNLRDRMGTKIVQATDPMDLIVQLRAGGFSVLQDPAPAEV